MIKYYHRKFYYLCLFCSDWTLSGLPSLVNSAKEIRMNQLRPAELPRKIYDNRLKIYKFIENKVLRGFSDFKSSDRVASDSFFISPDRVAPDSFITFPNRVAKIDYSWTTPKIAVISIHGIFHGTYGALQKESLKKKP